MNLSIEIETQVNTESWTMLKIHEGWRQQKEAPFKIHFKKKIRMHFILDNTLRHRNKRTRAHKSKNNHHSAASCRTLCHVTKVRSSQTGFSSSSVNNKFNVLQWIQQSTFGMWLNETIALTNLHQLCDAFMSAWTKSVRGTFPATSWIYATKNHSSSENKTEANLVLPRCKW